ncbi:MAG TPA: DUF4153 domain-containing protein [Sphingobium sp.]
MQGTDREAQPWPLRAAVLALLGAAGGVAIYLLLDRPLPDGFVAQRYALATFIGIALLAFGHAWVRGRLVRAVGIGAVSGVVVALVFLWNGTPSDDWSGGENWRIVAALLAVFLFVPMAQAGGERAEGAPGFRAPPHWSPPGFAAWVRDNFDYATVHEHGWTNLITVGLSVLFAGVFFLMLLLVGALFDLVHVSFLKQWLQDGIVITAIWGGAIGGSTGLLRDHQRIISGLQTVAMTVLRIAAPILGVSLALFLAILPLTGLAPLWDATRSTTPILLCAAVIALVLSNSVIGHGRNIGGKDMEERAPILRLSALILTLVTGPLAVIAAISTGLRVGQYGWTPERLWAATFVVMACVVALGYLAAVVVGRRRWAETVRSANLLLAFLICTVALLLSTPLVRFDAIATRDQMARLADGRTAADKFDYRALWFDFGPTGKEAIRALARSGGTAAIRDFARQTQALKGRYAPDPLDARKREDTLGARLTVLPAGTALPPALRGALTQDGVCGGEGQCTVRLDSSGSVATVIRDRQKNCPNCWPNLSILVRTTGGWVSPGLAHSPDSQNPTAEIARARAAGVIGGRVEVRTEPYARVYIDGRPVDAPFPMENSTIVRRAP